MDGALYLDLPDSVKLVKFHWTPPEALSGPVPAASTVIITVSAFKCQRSVVVFALTSHTLCLQILPRCRLSF